MNDLAAKDPRSYSILGLWSAGCRKYLDGYTQDEAVQDYLELHPNATETEVRAELTRELAKQSGA